MTRRRGAVLGFVLAAAACLAAPARADRETAEFHARRGDKALQEKAWADAEQHYRRSLVEDVSFLPARLGLAEALLGAGQQAPGIDELRTFCEEASRVAPMPPAWSAVVAKGRRRLSELDALGNEIDRMLGAHVDALLDLAKRWKDKDPHVAAQAVDAALRLRPGDAKAIELHEAVQRVLGKATALFNGKDLAGWDGMSTDVWTVRNGALEGRAPKGGRTAYLPTSESSFFGSFDVLVEARMEPGTGAPLFGLGAAMAAEYDRVFFGMVKQDLCLWDYPGTKEAKREHYARWRDNLEPPLDPTAFTVYELRFRPDKVHALVNGTEVHAYDRPKTRAGGRVALQLQDCAVVIRRVEVIRR